MYNLPNRNEKYDFCLLLASGLNECGECRSKVMCPTGPKMVFGNHIFYSHFVAFSALCH